MQPDATPTLRTPPEELADPGSAMTPRFKVFFRWFARRYPRFLYVDRIVVAGSTQARGAGSRLYRELHALAVHDAVPLITCEFDIEPPNPASERFHARLGFREVGRQLLHGGRKTVSLQALDVAVGDTPLADAG